MKPVKRKKFLEIEYYRKKYGLMQQDLAILIGVKENTYSHKETGISSFSIDELLLIHGALNKLAKKYGDKPISLDDMLLGKN